MTAIKARDFREYAGVLVAVIIVLAFAAIGFAVVTAQLVFGEQVTFPENWVISMLSLANMFAGYLIGKQTSGSTVPAGQDLGSMDTSTVVVQTTTPTVATPVKAADDEKDS